MKARICIATFVWFALLFVLLITKQTVHKVKTIDMPEESPLIQRGDTLIVNQTDEGITINFCHDCKATENIYIVK